MIIAYVFSVCYENLSGKQKNITIGGVFTDFREKIVHGNEGLPFAAYFITPAHIRYRMNAHWHPEHETLYVQSGILRLRLNDTAYDLHGGDVVFIPGGVIHSAEPTDCTYSCFLVNLPLLMKKSDACMEFANRIGDGSIRVRTLLERGSDGFAALCRQMLAYEEQKNEGYPFFIKGVVFTFFGKIFGEGLYTEEPAERQTAEAMTGRMKAAILYMEENYASPIRLAELAALSDMTPNYFCHCFRSVVGQSPLEYLIRYRLAKAQYALRTTDRSVTEIALDSGFNDISYFIRAFRTQYGTTPKRYRAHATELPD